MGENPDGIRSASIAGKNLCGPLRPWRPLRLIFLLTQRTQRRKRKEVNTELMNTE